MTANVGLAIQCIGILLVALLSLSLRNSINSASLGFWTRAWISLSLALLSLFAAFQFDTHHNLFYAIYFFGEYSFGMFFIAGCRFHAKGKSIGRKYYFLLAPAAAVAIILPYGSRDFNDLFLIQAAIMAVLFAVSFLCLRPASREQKGSLGLRVTSAALMLLSIDYLHDVPVFGARKGLWGITVPAGYLQYTSIIDLILEILLGFGTVMVLLEGVRREVELANRRLTMARDKLELIARIDPLTEALNRHAFHSLLSGNESNSESQVDGSVAVIDIDNLKPLNDRFGHNVGDKAIRAVARAIRSLIRADDMLFRWGGDEFLVLMFNLHEEEAERRMCTLNEVLARHSAEWMSAPVEVRVSAGVRGFESLNDVANAIEAADKAMYESRQRAREHAKFPDAPRWDNVKMEDLSEHETICVEQSL
jgi:diguanylate cyclase (GGDEF)-like protein